MKICNLLFLLLVILYSCGDVKVETSQNWGFINSETEEMYNKGMRLAAENKVEESVIEFNNALKIEPQNILLFFQLGNSYKSLNKLDEAEKCYDKVLSATPVYKLVYPNYANLMLAKNDNVNAIKYGKIGFQKCETDEERAVCVFSVSAGYYNIDSCEQAIKYFQQLKKARKNNLTKYDTILGNSIHIKCENTSL